MRPNEAKGQLLTVEQTQAIALGVLNELDSFCKANGISYFLIGGALIGAVRSKKLIPWDDDIDVAMIRDDYYRFCREYVDNGKYSLYTYNRKANYRHGVAKLVDTSTVFIEPGTRDDPFGIFVDIFPLDYVRSENDKRIRSIHRRVLMYNYAHSISSEATKGAPIKNAIRFMLSKTLGSFSYVKAQERLERAMHETDGAYLANHWGAWGVKECVPKNVFGATVNIELNGRLYPCPVGYEEWLARVYGDYMHPPKNPPCYHGHAYLKGCS